MPIDIILDNTLKREKLLTLIRKNPDISIKNFRKLVPGLYGYLYRHDKEWLLMALPRNKGQQGLCSLRVNWNKRDEEICNEAKTAVASIMNDTGKQTRITKGAVGARIGRLAIINKHLDKLPRTKKYLLEMQESIEDFQVRRIQYVAGQMKQQYANFTASQLIKKAGIRLPFSEKVAEEIRLQITR